MREHQSTPQNVLRPLVAIAEARYSRSGEASTETLAVLGRCTPAVAAHIGRRAAGRSHRAELTPLNDPATTVTLVNLNAVIVIAAKDSYGDGTISRPLPRVLESSSMPTTARRVHYTYAEYLSLEVEGSVRHEYLEGEIYAMAGGSPDHAALAAALIAILRSKLPPGCRVFTSDLRVRIPATGLSTYPDAAVVCGRTQRAPDDVLAVVNPQLLVQVTSPSTEEYDRGEKLRHYKHLPSLREVVIVSHREPRLTLHRREDGEWTVLEVAHGGIVGLASLAAEIAVNEVYRDGLEDAG